MSIEETKKSLPVYPFKQDLIEAVRAHQVSKYYSSRAYTGYFLERREARTHNPGPTVV